MIKLWVPIIGTGIISAAVHDPYRPDPGDLPLGLLFESAITEYLDPAHPSYRRPATVLCSILVAEDDVPFVTTATAPTPRDYAVAPISQLQRHPEKRWLMFQPLRRHFREVARLYAGPSGSLPQEVLDALECALALAIERGLRHSHARTLARRYDLPFPPSTT